MEAIRFVRPDDAVYVRVKEFNQSQAAGLVAGGAVDAEHLRQSPVSEEEQLSQEVRMYFPGGADDLQLFEVRVRPGGRGQAHAHAESEIMYVLEGDIEFGNRMYPAGSAIAILGGTLYAFRAGPAGVRFLNFRPRADFTYIAKDEFMARRAERKADVADGAGPDARGGGDG